VKENARSDEVEAPIISLAQFANHEEVGLLHIHLPCCHEHIRLDDCLTLTTVRLIARPKRCCSE
jgi:hypothetical protein